MALPTKRQAEIIDLMMDGPPEMLADFIDLNPQRMNRFLSRLDPEFDHAQFTDALRSNNSKAYKFCKNYIGRCLNQHVGKLPQYFLRKPKNFKQFLKKQHLEQDRKAILLTLSQSVGKALRGHIPSGLNIPIKGLALELNSLGVNYARRNIGGLTVSAASIAVVFMGLTTNTSNVEVAVPPSASNPTISNKTAILTPPPTGGSTRVYQKFRSMTNFIDGIMGQPLDNIPINSDEVYRPLLDLIAKHEASVGNYNAVYLPYAQANKGTSFDLTSMTVNEIRELQEKMDKEGFSSTALGRYQIITDTMDYLVRKMKLTGDEKFTQDLQDRMAITLLRRRGVDSYLAGKLPESDFVKLLSKEWASFPKDTTGASYYAGVGNNKALISYTEMLRGIKESSTLRIRLNVGKTEQLSFRLPKNGKIPIPGNAPRGPQNG